MKYKTKIGFNKGSESVCAGNQSTINSYSLFLIFAIFLIQPLAESKIIPIQSFYPTQNVSIQSGATLWKLAQKYYGQGQKWTHFQGFGMHYYRFYIRIDANLPTMYHPALCMLDLD